MGINSGIYKFLLVLHILVRDRRASGGAAERDLRPAGEDEEGPRGARDHARRTSSLPADRRVLHLRACSCSASLLVLVSDDAWSFGDTWIWLSMALYIVALGLSHGLLLPNVSQDDRAHGAARRDGPAARRRHRRRRRRRSSRSRSGAGVVGMSRSVLAPHLRRDPVPHDLEAEGSPTRPSVRSAVGGGFADRRSRSRSPRRRPRRVNFYDDVLRELIVALGAALFIGNLYALIRRRADRRQAAKRSVTRSRPGSPVRASGEGHPRARAARRRRRSGGRSATSCSGSS